MTGSLSWVADSVRATPAASPSTLSFLLKHYLQTGRLDLRDALEEGLAVAVSRTEVEPDACLRMRWLALYADASTLTDDGWMTEHVTARLPDVVDGLEGYVRRVYEPGEGLMGIDARGHAQCALALLDAFDLTGRLPYSMLADELYRTTMRGMATGPTPPGDALSTRDLDVRCLLAIVGCRLAALYRTPDYTTRVVVDRESDYARDVDRLLEPLASSYREHPEVAAEYGLAQLERFALSMYPN